MKGFKNFAVDLLRINIALTKNKINKVFRI